VEGRWKIIISVLRVSTPGQNPRVGQLRQIVSELSPIRARESNEKQARAPLWTNKNY